MAEKWSSISGACTGEITSGGTPYHDVATIQGIICVMANVFSSVFTLLSIVGFCMFVYASVMLLLSSGKSESLQKARETMTYAVFGLILGLSCFVILNIISNFTGVTTFLTINFSGQ